MSIPFYLGKTYKGFQYIAQPNIISVCGLCHGHHYFFYVAEMFNNGRRIKKIMKNECKGVQNSILFFDKNMES